MATRDEPLKDVVGGLLISVAHLLVFYLFPVYILSTVRHESPPHWIFKSKDVLESQDADLEVSGGSYVPKNLSTRRTMPLKSSKILSNPIYLESVTNNSLPKETVCPPWLQLAAVVVIHKRFEVLLLISAVPDSQR